MIIILFFSLTINKNGGSAAVWGEASPIFFYFVVF
jgi:hypothetical protein